MTFPFPIFVPMAQEAAPPATNIAYADFDEFAQFDTELPADDSVPQITEGDELLQVAITPSSASAKILVRFSVPIRPKYEWRFDYVTEQEAFSITWCAALALFRGSTCIHACAHNVGWDDFGTVLSGVILDEPGTTSPVIYSIRVGGTELEEGENGLTLDNPGLGVAVNGGYLNVEIFELGTPVEQITQQGRLFGGAGRATLFAWEIS